MVCVGFWFGLVWWEFFCGLQVFIYSGKWELRIGIPFVFFSLLIFFYGKIFAYFVEDVLLTF